jgi:hypothetical protein
MVVGCAGKSIIHKVQSIDQLNHALSLHLWYRRCNSLQHQSDELPPTEPALTNTTIFTKLERTYTPQFFGWNESLPSKVSEYTLIMRIPMGSPALV